MSTIEHSLSASETEQILSKALDIGEAMLKCGAEITRVEDTIKRICLSYGGGTVDVFSIVSLIIVSWRPTDRNSYTQTRRVYSYSTDLNKLEELNALSRYLCENLPPIAEIEEKLNQIINTKDKSSIRLLLGYILAASSFSVFFGGNLQDAFAAAIVASLLYIIDRLHSKHSYNRMVYTYFCSFQAGIFSILIVMLKLGVHVDKIMIGNIMLLIPGIGITNSVRDMLSGELITGLLRFVEALLIAVAVAAGFATALILFHELS